MFEITINDLIEAPFQSPGMRRRKMFGFNFVVVFFLICLFIYLPFFFFCLPIRLVYSPRFGGQKRPRGRRLRYEDR